MKFFTAIISLATCLTCLAGDVGSTVLTELAKIEIEKDYCQIAISSNKIIQLGEPAVTMLGEALINPRNGLRMKWSIAQVLGEIGSAQAIPALKIALTSDNEWLRDVAKLALSKISGETKKLGKVYLTTIGKQTTQTDCETGAVEVIK